MLNTEKFLVLAAIMVMILGGVGSVWALEEDACRGCHSETQCYPLHWTTQDCSCDSISCHPTVGNPPATVIVHNCVHSGCHDGYQDPEPDVCDGSDFPNIDCKPVPAWCNIVNPDPIIVPVKPTVSRGGNLEVRAIAGSNYNGSGPAYFGTKITHVDGPIQTSWLIGPVQLYFTPYEIKTAILSYEIPDGWPTGNYTYDAYVGNQYGIIWDEAHFKFQVE